MLRITGLVTSDAAMGAMLSQRVLPPPDDGPAAATVLTGRRRAAWMEAHLAVLESLARQTGIGMPAIERDALVIAAGRISEAQAGVADAMLQAAIGQGWSVDVAAAPANPGTLDPGQRRMLSAGLLSFLHSSAPPSTPLVIDCEMAVPPAPLPVVDDRVFELSRLQPEGGRPLFTTLGGIGLDADGLRWAVQPFISNDDSRLQRFSAALYELAGIAVAPTRLFADDRGGLRAAWCVPPGLAQHKASWSSASARASYVDGLAVDAWTSNGSVRGRLYGHFGIVNGHTLRLSMDQALCALADRPHRCGNGPATDWAAMPDLLRWLLHPSIYEPGELAELMRKDISLEALGRSVRRVLAIGNDQLQALGERFPLDDAQRQQRTVALLAARRNFMGALPFLERLEGQYYEWGTSPLETRGQVVWRIVDEQMGALRGAPHTAPARAAPRPLEVPASPAVSPHQPPSALIDTVRGLLADPEYLRHPVARGGVRLVYPIPGQPFLFKLNRRAAESLITWRLQHGGGRLPETVIDEGRRHAQRLNQRHGMMVHHLRPDWVYPEWSFVVPEAVVPDRILSGLDAAARRDAGHRLPVLGSIQALFPYVGMPDLLEYRVPYSERISPAGGIDHAPRPFANEYKAALVRWVLNGNHPGLGSDDPVTFRNVHPWSTADRFIAQCVAEPPLMELATDFFRALIADYCPATGESIDLSGPKNAFWYLDRNGERKLALLDSLYPDDSPILASAPDHMEQFLRGEPLTISQKADLLNAINFARAANYIASRLAIRERIDLFPDEFMKARVSAQFNEIYEMLNRIPFHYAEPHPESPWGGF
jgi:hypothetical protein